MEVANGTDIRGSETATSSLGVFVDRSVVRGDATVTGATGGFGGSNALLVGDSEVRGCVTLAGTAGAEAAGP